MIKNFKDYLTENAKKYDFRIKIACDITNEQSDTIKSLLDRFQLSGFKKTGKTPIQDLPLDFPKIKNAEVSIFEVTLDYPTTPWELREYICNNFAGITLDEIVVRAPSEPSEEYQATKESRREDALLNDIDYKEAENAKFEDFYGDKYNSGFVKELNDILKLQRKARGEIIPSDTDVKYNSDSVANNTSILTQAKDPRKK